MTSTSPQFEGYTQRDERASYRSSVNHVFEYRNPEDPTKGVHAEYKHHPETHFTDLRPEEVYDNGSHPADGLGRTQGKLFHTEPQYNPVTTLFATKESTHEAMGVLGQLANHVQRTHGGHLESSDDLSRYSDALVDKAVAKGLISNPRKSGDYRHPDNGEDFQSAKGLMSNRGDPVDNDLKVPGHKVQAGFDRIREALRRTPSQPATSHQFDDVHPEQGRLF